MAKKATGPGKVPEQTVNILEKAVLVSLRFRNLGNHAKVSTDRVTADSDKDMLHVSKSLLDSEEFRAVSNHRGRWKNYLASRAIHSPLAGTATYVLPLALLSEVEVKSSQFQTADDELVAAFCAVYPQRVAEAKDRLRELFDERDYPPVGQVRAAFGVRMAYLALSTPESLRTVSETVYAREKVKFAASLEEAANDIRAALREAMADLVTGMVSRLSDSEDGKRKRFTAKMTTRLEDFLATFQARNLTDDAVLATLVKKAQGLVRGLDVEALKGDEELRKRVREGFAVVKASLDPLIENRPTRRIVLED